MMTVVTLTQVWRIFHTDGYYPYHLQRVRNFLLDDHASRVQCFEWLQAHFSTFPDILFTYEAEFTCDSLNKVWYYSWVHENPHEVAECYFQCHFSANVWCRMSGNCLIGPHFIEGCLTAAYYRHFLQIDILL
jgi:hypothetical protein